MITWSKEAKPHEFQAICIKTSQLDDRICPCSSPRTHGAHVRPGQERLARPNETILDQADGLNWKTFCRCDLLFTVDKSSLTNKRG